MNILTVTANDNGMGGAARIAMDLHRVYAAAGHKVSALVGRKTTDLPDVVELRRPAWRKALSYLLANDFDFFDGGQVLRSVAFREADIVHCHNLNGWYFNLPILIEMSRRKPVVWTLHDMWSLTPHSAHTESRQLRHGLYTLSDPALYPATLWNNDYWLARRKAGIYRSMRAHVVTPCHWLSALVEPTALGGQSRSVIYNGIDTSPFRLRDKAEARAELGLGSGRVVLYVGSTNSSFKGYEDFDWLAQTNVGEDVRFVCLGAEEDGLRSNVQQVRATPDKARIAAFMAAADVLVIPSRHEVFPTVMLEAAACGTPVVAYDVGGIAELLATTAGCVVVPPKDRERLRAGVQEVLERSSNEVALIAPALRQRIETTFTVRAMSAEYLSLFQQLLDDRS